MSSSLENIIKLPLIESAIEIQFTKVFSEKLKKILNHNYFLRAQQNARKITVYEIRYRSNGHLVGGYILQPRNNRKQLPVIIANRGGYKDFGDFRHGRVFNELGNMAQWGYSVFASQLSGSRMSEGEDEFGGKDVDDIINLYDIIRAYHYADEKRIGMYGHSRGAMMAFLCLRRVSWLRALVCIAGPTNMLRLLQLRPELKKALRDSNALSREWMEKRSALFWTKKLPKRTPILLMHGTADWRVTPIDSLEFSTKLLEHKVPHRLVLFEGADHALSEFTQEYFQEMKKWFDRYVKDGLQLPNLTPHGE